MTLRPSGPRKWRTRSAEVSAGQNRPVSRFYSPRPDFLKNDFVVFLLRPFQRVHPEMTVKTHSMTTCRLMDLGLIDFEEAYARQMQEVRRTIAGEGPILILCEHPTVLT